MTIVSPSTSSTSPKTFPPHSLSPQPSPPRQIRPTPRPSRSSPFSRGPSTTFNSPTSSQMAVAAGIFTYPAHTSRSCSPAACSSKTARSRSVPSPGMPYQPLLLTPLSIAPPSRCPVQTSSTPPPQNPPLNLMYVANSTKSPPSPTPTSPS